MKRVIFTMLVFWLVPGVALSDVDTADTESDRTLAPYFFIENGDDSLDQLPLKSTRVQVNITGVIAHVNVTQTYQNNGKRPIHARYIFPASTRAAVHGMTLTIGSRKIRAQIKERAAAQKTYDKAKKEGKQAALLKQHRPNVFSMNVANIMPGDTIMVALHYSEMIVPTEGVYEFVFPTVVGPRYSNQPEASASPNDQFVANPYLPEGKKSKTDFDLTARISTGLPLQGLVCDSHKVDVEWKNKATAHVRIAADEPAADTKDVILRYRLKGNQIQTGLMLYPGEKENFFLMMMQPPERVMANQLPPREYIFVVDVSGSMSGFPLDTVKDLMSSLIQTLTPRDSFNILLFSGASKLMATESLPATQANLNDAIRFMKRQRGGGGTELFKALHRAYDLPDDPGRSRSMIVVTDGYISIERKVFELIRERLDEANLFAFGIGDGVNRYLIEGMARSGQGEPFIVTSPRTAGKTAARFRNYIASPVLTRVKAEFVGLDAYDVEPASVPDLFADRPVILFGKYRGGAVGIIRVTGQTGKGPFQKTIRVSEADRNPANQSLKYLWARSRLARLSDYEGDIHHPEIKSEITELGLTYNLLTAHTSFVAVHERIKNLKGDGVEVKQPLPLPEGVSNLAVGNGRRVPEPGLLLLIVCLLPGTMLFPQGRRAMRAFWHFAGRRAG